MTEFDYAGKCNSKLISFARVVYPDFEDPIHVRKIGEALEEVERGENRRLIITVPPRHSKSLFASQIFPAWYLGKHPREKVLLASNTHMLAADFGRNCRNMMQSDEYKLVFPDVEVSEDSRAKNTFKTNKGGEAFFLGVGGTLVGRGFHLGLIDDPVKNAEEADSAVYIKKLHDWYREVLYTRQMPGGKIVLIMQRWRHNDLIGWLLDPNEQEKVEPWKIINFPAIATEDCDWRKQGEALWPARYPLEELEKIRLAIGSRSFGGLYQQAPSMEEGNIFKREWLNEEVVDSNDLIRPRIMAVDTAYKEGAANDFSAVCIAERTKKGIAILYAEHRKLAFPALLAWIKALVDVYHLDGLLIEDKASGISIIQTLRQHSRIPVIPISIKKGEDKVSRANAVCPFLESKRVVIHKFTPGHQREEFINELLQFDQGIHDDQVDAMVHALTYLIRGGNNLKRLVGGRTLHEIPNIYGR